MFDSIQGRLAARDPARVVVEAGGLGYVIQVSLSTWEALPAVGSEVRLLLYPVVREDDWRLFGFLTPEEREAFRALLRVSGVGPAVSLSLLSGLGAEALVRAVVDADVRALTRVKGVGKKTAERIVLDLREPWAESAPGGPPRTPRGSLTGAAADAVRALESLGLARAEAETRVAAQLEKRRDAPLAELVRRALRESG